MSTTPENTPVPKPKKSKVLIVLALILTLLVGVNHYTFRIGYTDVTVTVTDSTIVVGPTIDTVTVDSLKK